MSNFNNTVLPIVPGLDEYISMTHSSPMTKYSVEQMIQRLQDEFHSTIQRQANQIIELQSEIAELKRSQRETDETIIGMNSEMERMNRWAVVTVEEIDELRNMIEEHDIGGLAKDMKAKSVEYTSMSRVFTRDLAELCHIRNRIVPKMASWIDYFDQAGDIRLPQVERELNEERFKKIEARLAVNEGISTSEAADQIDLLKEKIAEIEEMEANYLKSVNKLSSEVFDMRYAVKHITSGLYNMDTQRATWKDLMTLIDKNNIFKTNSKFDASLQTTSKWHDLPTTRQGDECEARLDKVEVKGGEYDDRLKRLEAKMQMIAKGFATSDDC